MELPTRSCGALLVAAALLLAAAPARAQDRLPGVRPGDERPELPPFEAPEREREDILPPVPIPQEPGTSGLAGGERLYVESYRIRGSTVLAEEELTELTAPYVRREVSFAELQALRDALTRALIERGYVTSGAVVPDQRVEDGVVRIDIVEGVLAEVDVETEGRLHDHYTRSRLQRHVGGVVNVRDVERRLQVLQQDPRIERVQASLVPGDVRGESRLDVHVDEATPWLLRVEGNNHQSPSIGAARLVATLAALDLTGFGDGLMASYTHSEGLDEIEAWYTLPLTRFDTELELHADLSWSKVVEEPFDVLDIESRVQSYGITLRQPVYRSLHSRVRLFVTGEWRRSKTFLLGIGFPFAAGVAEDGVSKVAVLRAGFDWTRRSRDQVLAFRSQVSVGNSVLGATNNGGNIPDSEFVAGLVQAQWARRLPWLGAQVIARGDAQLANDPLLGLEQFAVGGVNTVRGYRENTFVRDNGLVGSLELRVPIFDIRLPFPETNRIPPRVRLEVGPFVDAGYSWNADTETFGPTTLWSTGVHAILTVFERLRFDVSWGHRLKDLPDPPDPDLQDDGLHMGVSFTLP